MIFFSSSGPGIVLPAKRSYDAILNIYPQCYPIFMLQKNNRPPSCIVIVPSHNL